jgi:hypothetical protein
VDRRRDRLEVKRRALLLRDVRVDLGGPALRKTDEKGRLFLEFGLAVDREPMFRGDEICTARVRELG